MLIAYFALLAVGRRDFTIITDRKVSGFRRLLAFHIDCFTAMIGVLPIIAIPNYFIKYLRTSILYWEPGRELFVLQFAIFLFGFFGFFYFFFWHYRNGRQTPGQYLLGYIVTLDKKDLETSHTIISALYLWPLKVKSLFYDEPESRFSSEPRRVKYSNRG